MSPRRESAAEEMGSRAVRTQYTAAAGSLTGGRRHATIHVLMRARTRLPRFAAWAAFAAASSGCVPIRDAIRYPGVKPASPEQRKAAYDQVVRDILACPMTGKEHWLRSVLPFRKLDYRLEPPSFRAAAPEGVAVRECSLTYAHFPARRKKYGRPPADSWAGKIKPKGAAERVISVPPGGLGAFYKDGDGLAAHLGAALGAETLREGPFTWLDEAGPSDVAYTYLLALPDGVSHLLLKYHTGADYSAGNRLHATRSRVSIDVYAVDPEPIGRPGLTLTWPPGGKDLLREYYAEAFQLGAQARRERAAERRLEAAERQERQRRLAAGLSQAVLEASFRSQAEARERDARMAQSRESVQAAVAQAEALRLAETTGVEARPAETSPRPSPTASSPERGSDAAPAPVSAAPAPAAPRTEELAEAVSYCWQPDKGRWQCDSPYSRMSTSERALESAEKAVSCRATRKKSALPGGGTVYFCGIPLEPYHYDVVALHGLSVETERKRFSCPAGKPRTLCTPK